VTPFLEKLAATSRSPDIPPEADLYGWLIGSWELDVLHYAVDVRDRHIKGEAHFSWVLEGRAVQDVWIMKAAGLVNTYGMTFRVWDAALQAWRVTWTNPISGRRDELIGRAHGGKDLVQLGVRADGTAIRWRFTETTPTSFHWLGEALNPDGESWRLESAFFGRKA
jgi:hypothetical protein